MNIELRQLNYLTTIAEEGSFTRAAEKLFVTQSALSQQIQKLEDEVGLPLLERAPRHIRLTAAGKLLSVRAHNIFKELSNAEVAIQELQGIQRGSLAVGVVQTINHYLVPQVVAQFIRDYPNIEIHIQELRADDIEARLRSGELQLGIGFMPLESADIEAELIFTEDLVLIVANDHPLAAQQQVDWSAIDGVPLALLPTNYCTRRLVETSASHAGITLNTRVEMTAIDALLTTVEYTTLATILPKLAFTQRRSTGLHSLQLCNPTPIRAVGLLSYRYAYRCAASRAFAAAVSAAVALTEQQPSGGIA